MTAELKPYNIIDKLDEDAAKGIVPALREALTPMHMLDRAVSSNAGIDVIEKMMGLQERWEKNQARKSFDAAIAAAKVEIPAVVRNKEGHNKKRYADFSAIAKAVDPILGKHGLSYRFRTTQDERIHVTCVLSHKDGHSEETSLAERPDTSGNKNTIQALGSTLTYLQRYSLVQMLGIAVADDDDGATLSESDKISQAQTAELVDLADDVGADKEKFCKYLKIAALADIPAKDFDHARRLLEAKRGSK
jgi:hypothetical protein